MTTVDQDQAGDADGAGAGERRRALVRAALGLHGPGDVPDPDRVYHVDPRLLVVHRNVRRDRRPKLGFSVSLKRRGVLQVIECYLDDGELMVAMGSRRAFFATAADVPTVRVLVQPEPPDPVDLIVDQLSENLHREPLSAGEEAAGVEQLALLGLPLGDIAVELARGRSDVDAALKVARSPAARAAAAEHQLDMAPLAAVAEVDDDPDAVAAVLAAAADPERSGGVEHVLERVRLERRDAADRAAAAAALRRQGVWVLDERPAADSPARRLTELHLEVTDHSPCRGHAAYLVGRDGVVDGHRDVEWVPEWVCVDPRGYGHGGQQRSLEQAARDTDQARRRAEGQRLDREWRAAEQVRRRWLRDLAQRPAAPAGADRFVLESLLDGDQALARAMARPSRHQLLRDLLGVPHTDAQAGVGELLIRARTARSSSRLVLLTVLVLLAAAEEQLEVHGWARPTNPDRRYLRQLATWGYPLTPVERRLCGDEPADDDVDAAADTDRAVETRRHG